ncbi:MAG: ABC transporter permease [Deltaproteobacteria bacterium]|nr:ABC transporter permease [Deltaproteobacteria bacterium]
MNLFNVAFDVLRELLARKFILAAGIFVSIGMLGLIVTLDLDVVDGAISSARIFGLGGALSEGVDADAALGTVFKAFTYVVFYVGLLFGVVSTADIAAKMLSPGRVELYLSLPVRRVELVVGTYLGVMLIATLGTAFTVGGVSLILFLKAELVTFAPLAGAACAIIGFSALYGVMLLSTTLVRSSALAAGVGLMTFLAGVITSNREGFLSFFSGIPQSVIEVLIAPLPRFMSLAELGARAQASASAAETTVKAADALQAGPIIGGTLIFAAAMVGLATFVVSSKDY